MKRFNKIVLSLGVCLLLGTLQVKACNNSLITLVNQVDNGDGSYTYTLNLTTELGGLDVPFYGFALSFNSAFNTPSIVAGSYDATITPGEITSGTTVENLIGLTGAAVNSEALDSDFNKYDNLTNVLTYESYYAATTDDISLTVTVTVMGCVESIVYDASVNSGASSCRKTVSTGQNCQCLASANPTSPDPSDTICQDIGGTLSLEGNVTGTLGTNPSYSWSSTDPTVDALITNSNQENASVTFPVNFTAGAYPINFTYTDDNACSISKDLTFTIASDGVGSCTNMCDFSTLQNVVITPGGDHNATVGYTQIYVLTDLDSLIVDTSSTGDFGIQPANSYLIFGFNYENADAPSPLPAPGVNLNNITGGCFDLSNPLHIGVCEPCSDPVSQPTNITLQHENSTSFEISWTNATATDVIVVIREVDSTSNDPVPGTNYTGNTVFGSGDNLGNGNFILYSGVTSGASPFTVTGLSMSTTYVVSVYAANDTCILTTAPLVDTATTGSCSEPTTLPSNLSITALTGNSVSASWTNGSGDQVLVTLRADTSDHSDPVSGTSYTGNTVYGSGDQIAPGHYVIYSGGTGVSSGTITNLTTNTTYVLSVYTFNATGNCYNVVETDTIFTTPFENNISNDTLHICGGLLYDDGGPSGNYANGPDIITVLMPTNPGDGVCLNFTQWTIDYSIFGYSELSFYDGTSTSDPLIMTATGDWVVDEAGTTFDFNGPGMVCAKGPMTLKWNPDDVDAGWEAEVTCYTPLDTPSCSITVNTDTTICSGETLDLTAFGEIVNVPLYNTFNDSTVGLGWSTSVDARFDNPCGAGPDSSHLWMGIEPSPRALTSGTYDASMGGTISFDFKMAVQAGAAPCEGPDEVQEGVYLQYSTDGGTSWTTIHYFFPSFYTDGSTHTLNWQSYVFDIPSGAQTSSTAFRWIQNDISSNSTDHWGLDNVTISIPNNSTTIVWDNGLGSGANKTVSPTSNTTYTVTISDGTSSCQASVNVTMCSPMSINSSSFNGVCNGNKVELNWEGYTDTEEEEYIVEKAIGNMNFSEIGRIPVRSGHVQSNQNYSYTDFSAPDALNYYRIKVKNSEGQNTYTDIIGPLGNCELVENGVYDSYFDSETGQLVLFYNVTENTPFDLMIYDLSGRLVFAKNIELAAGIGQSRIQIRCHLTSSIYVIQVAGSSGVFHQKLYVQSK